MKNNKGFTLIELLVVVLIIGILSAVALPQYTRAVEKARVAEVETIMADLRRGYKVYRAANPRRKASGSGMNAVVDLSMPSLEDIMKAGGFSYPLSNGKIVTKNFTFNQPSVLMMVGGCSGEFSASRTDGSYSVYFSASDPVTKCCQGSTDKGKDLCKGLGNGWTTASGRDLEIIDGPVFVRP